MKNIWKKLINAVYGKHGDRKKEAIMREKINALLEANYYGQIIGEACNGDDEHNHFRKNMTLADCVQSQWSLDIWSRYASSFDCDVQKHDRIVYCDTDSIYTC